MNAPYAAAIERALQAVRPRSLLAVGTAAADVLAPFSHRTDCRYLALPAADMGLLADQSRFDLALVSTSANVKAPLLHLLAALRDRYAQYLYVALETPAQASLTHTELLALGMHHVADYGDTAITHALYAFNIADYKSTPDWLNSQHWAHPELFDKFRW